MGSLKLAGISGEVFSWLAAPRANEAKRRAANKGEPTILRSITISPQGSFEKSAASTWRPGPRFVQK
jgi:hypothetical protein